MTFTRENDRHATRSAASTSVERRQVRFSITDEDEVLQTSAKSLRLQNANGADVEIYPGFVLLRDRADIALIDLREVTIEFSQSQFVEEGTVPPDASVVGTVWAKTNKDGSPDRRFRDNYQIPLVRYGEILFQSALGLNESYMFSNYEKAERLARTFNEYQAALRALAEKSAPLHATGGKPAAADGDVGSVTAPQAARPSTMKAVEFISARSAISMDDAVRIMEKFAALLKGDMESMNGQSRPVSDFHRFVNDIASVSPNVHGFFVRSHAAKPLEAVAVRETNKMMAKVLEQLETALDPKKGAADVEELLRLVKDTRATLSE